MNNEKYNQIIDEVYERYWDSIKTSQYDGFGPTSIKLPTLTKQDFINRCKTDSKFSEKWGLKIEERELSGDERFRIAYKNLELRKKLELESMNLHYPNGHNKVMDDANVPTKLITVTYNDIKTEIYE